MMDKDVQAALRDAQAAADDLRNATREELIHKITMFAAKVVRANAELRRLRAENTAMREIVQAVANDNWGTYEGRDGGEYEFGCPFCLNDTHYPECPVTKARALLGAGR